MPTKSDFITPTSIDFIQKSIARPSLLHGMLLLPGTYNSKPVRTTHTLEPQTYEHPPAHGALLDSLASTGNVASSPGPASFPVAREESPLQMVKTFVLTHKSPEDRPKHTLVQLLAEHFQLLFKVLLRGRRSTTSIYTILNPGNSLDTLANRDRRDRESVLLFHSREHGRHRIPTVCLLCQHGKFLRAVVASGSVVGASIGSTSGILLMERRLSNHGSARQLRHLLLSFHIDLGNVWSTWRRRRDSGSASVSIRSCVRTSR